MYVIKLNDGRYHQGGFRNSPTTSLELAKFYHNEPAAKAVITQVLKWASWLSKFRDGIIEIVANYQNATIVSVCVMEDPKIEIDIDCREKVVYVEGLPDEVMIDIPGFQLYDEGEFD